VKNDDSIRQVGLEIKRRRTELGFTQEEFADVSGLHRTYISGIERGERNATLDVIFQIAKALQCEPGSLFEKSPR
jgi:transcriptional regulator with XRE-family HTH domain